MIRVLMELGLPQELAWELVYKWKVVEHPAAIALRTDPWLRRVREQYERCVLPAERVADVRPSSTCCVCPGNKTEGDEFDWENGQLHGHVIPYIWFLVSEKSKAWQKRTCGPEKEPRAVMSFLCNRSILCMRYFRHTITAIDAKIRETNLLDQGSHTGADCVTNEDYSLATWLRHAPLWALKEYLQGVTGWTEKEVEHQVNKHWLNTKSGEWVIARRGVVKMCLEH